MNILYVATIGGFMPFFKSIIKELLDDGHQVDIATNMSQYPLPEYYSEWGCGIYQISCSRSPLNKGNFVAINELKQIVSKRHYDIIHCHTPIAAACTRVACRKIRKQNTKVIYTAHGFHFYKGAPIRNWILFYPIEKICAHWTDVLVTINKEDYNLASKKLKAKEIKYVPGVGIDIYKFLNDPTNKQLKRKELGIPEDAYVLLSVGELNTNKNHQIVIKAINKLQNQNTHYVIAGKGELKNHLLELAKEYNVENNLHLIGYRADIPELYKMADVYILPSIREGLNVSIMEAMSSGLPCIVSDIRGNRDLIDNQKGGLLFNPFNINEVVSCINNTEKNKTFGYYNSEKSHVYDITTINKQMIDIYRGTK